MLISLGMALMSAPALHRSYPKLGVAGRHQLRDVIDRAKTPAEGDTPASTASSDPVVKRR